MQTHATLDGANALMVHHTMTEDDYLAREAGSHGICLVCRAWAGGVDPGVAAANCPACGRRGVHGVDQALLMGFIRICR